MNSSTLDSSAQATLDGKRSGFWLFGSNLETALALLSIVVVISLFYWPLLAGIYTIFDIGPDLTIMAVPDLTLRANALREGIIPVWDPYEMGGQSPLGEVTPAVLDPFSYPLLLMPLKNGHIPLGYIQTYYVLLHCFAAVAGYLLIRNLRVRSHLAAVIGGIFYALGGVPGNALWFQVVTEAIYAPLVLLFVIRGLRGHRPLANNAMAGLLLGLSWFSGTHHIPLMMSLTCGALLLVFVFFGDLRLGLLRLAVLSGVMILISAPQVIPALQWAQNSMRWVLLDRPIEGDSKVPYLAHLIEDIHPSSLLSILIPGQTRWEPFLFAGIVGTVFAFLALASIGSSRWIRVCLALIVGGILMSLSEHNVLYGFIYLLVPAFDKLRESAFWTFPAHLGLTCLVGLGADAVLRRGHRDLERQLAKILAASGAALLVLSFFGTFLSAPHLLERYDVLSTSGLVALLLACSFYLLSRNLLKPGLAIALVLGLLLVEQGNVAGHLRQPRGHGNTSQFEQPLLATQVLADFLRTRPDLKRIDVNQTDLPMNFGDYHMMEEMSSHGGTMLTSVFRIRFWTPRARQLYGVNYYLARKPSQSDQVEVFTAPSGIKVFTNPGARPRTWSVHRVLSVSNYDRAVALLSSPSFDMATTSFVQGEPPQTEECGAPDQVQLVQRSWFSVVIRANMTCTGMVVLNDNWYPGWKASVDGHRVQTYSAYMTIRGVIVGSGNHVIEMHYRPRSLIFSFILFAAGLIATIWLVRRTETSGSDLLA